MFCKLMGLRFSRRRPTSRLNNKISEHISASVTPLHVCLEEQRGPELGSCESTTRKPRVTNLSFLIILSDQIFSHFCASLFDNRNIMILIGFELRAFLIEV